MAKKLFSLIVLLVVLSGFPANSSVTRARRLTADAHQAYTNPLNRHQFTLKETHAAPAQEYLLRLPVPSPEEVLDSYLPFDYPAYFQIASQPALESLTRLQAEGKVAQFKPDLEDFAIRVRITANGDPSDLQTIRGVESVQEATVPPACPADPAVAVQDVLEAARVYRERSRAPSRPQSVAAGAPTIEVYISSYVSYGTRYSSVGGYVSPGTSVHIRVEASDGDVVIERTVTSFDNGFYYLGPDWRTCEGYGWSLTAGQTVIVEAQGQTAVMQIPVIESTADPDADSVTGRTAPHRNVMLRVSPTAAVCDSQPYTATVTSASDGTFQFNLAAQGGFDHSGWIGAYVYDSNGNYTYTSLIVPHIALNPWSVRGRVAKPGAYVTVQQLRDGNVIETMSTTANESGYFHVYPSDLRAGDRVEVEASGLTMRYDVAPLDDVLVDMPNGQITGTTTPGLRVQSDDYDHCSGHYVCDADIANVSGDFTVNLSSDMLRQDDVGVYVYDDQGHYRYGWFYPPYVQYTRTSYERSYIEGHWYYGASEVTVRVYNGDTVEEEYAYTLSGDNLRYFVVDVDHRVPFGRRIEVSDGTHTRSIVVQGLEARLDAAGDTVVGVAPTSGVLDIEALHQLPGYSWAYSSYACGVTADASGSYQADVSGYYDLVSDDSVLVTYFESDGDRLFVWGYDVSINVASTVDVAPSMSNDLRDVGERIFVPSGDGYWFSIYGNRANKDQPITIKVYASDGSTLRESRTDSSVPSRSYYFSFSDFPLQPGDIIRASNGAYSTSFTVPHLTLDESPQENRLYGDGPAYATVYPHLYLPGRSVYWYTTVQVGSDGHYSASFDRVYPTSYWWYGCGETTVGGCRQSKVTYYDAVGHSLTVEAEFPEGVSADVYDEGDSDDNTPERASVYHYTQSHTFHTWDDVDWIAVNIPESNVGRVYSFQTFNLGDIARTSLYLYDTDQTTLLASYTGPDDAAVVRWQPVHAGWYYVKVTPRSWRSTYYCGATYDFRIRLEAEWTALIYMNGDSNLGICASSALHRLEQVVGQLQGVNVLMLWDGQGTNSGDTWLYHVQPNGAYTDGENRWYKGELNLADGDILADFLTWGMENYPANHYYVAIADHGKGTVGISWDFNSYVGENTGGKAKKFNNSDRITPMELRDALARATQNGTQRIDVLHYDACLMGMWEHAYQVKDYADYLVFSQNEGWAVFAFDKYVQSLKGRTAQSAATEIARLYSVEVELEDRPYTISAIDLSQMNSLSQQVDQLASLLEGGMNTYKQQVQASRRATQRLDSTADFELTEEDTMLDLYDFAAQIKTQISDASVQDAATAVQEAVDQAVVAEYHHSGKVNGISLNLDNVHGLSIYFPMQSGRLFSVYAGGQMFKSTLDSRWDETLTEYYGAMGLPPVMDDPDDTAPTIGGVLEAIYLPVVMRNH